MCYELIYMRFVCTFEKDKFGLAVSLAVKIPIRECLDLIASSAINSIFLPMQTLSGRQKLWLRYLASCTHVGFRNWVPSFCLQSTKHCRHLRSQPVVTSSLPSVHLSVCFTVCLKERKYKAAFLFSGILRWPGKVWSLLIRYYCLLLKDKTQ